MTYNVFGGTLNLAQFKFNSSLSRSRYNSMFVAPLSLPPSLSSPAISVKPLIKIGKVFTEIREVEICLLSLLWRYNSL